MFEKPLGNTGRTGFVKKIHDIGKRARAEVTFYCKDTVLSDNCMEDALLRVTEYVSTTIVYSTPFAGTWKAYCDAMLHSLIGRYRSNTRCWFDRLHVQRDDKEHEWTVCGTQVRQRTVVPFQPYT